MTADITVEQRNLIIETLYKNQTAAHVAYSYLYQILGDCDVTATALAAWLAVVEIANQFMLVDPFRK